MSLAGVVFLPSTPMLLPEHVGLADPIADLRERCVATLSETLGQGADRVHICCDTRPSPVGGWTGAPLGERVGRRLLALAGWAGPVDAAPGPHEDGSVLVVAVGDGSARRSEKAPGHLDERSFAVDDAILAALTAADPGAILDLDPGLCDELLVTGLPALQAAAYAVRGRTDLRGEVLWSGDPYGVMYWVARWATDPARRAG